MFSFLTKPVDGLTLDVNWSWFGLIFQIPCITFINCFSSGCKRVMWLHVLRFLGEHVYFTILHIACYSQFLCFEVYSLKLKVQCWCLGSSGLCMFMRWHLSFPCARSWRIVMEKCTCDQLITVCNPGKIVWQFTCMGLVILG